MVDRQPTSCSLHTRAEAARLLGITPARVDAMITAGQLATVQPAGLAYERVTGASILAFASRVPDKPTRVRPRRDPEIAFILERAGL